MERWKDIKGLENFYQVSDRGRIKRLRRIDNHGREWPELILKSTVQPNGYVIAHISIEGKNIRLLVHRAVAEAFCNKPNGCDIVNHIDNNPSNNSADNLEWTTYKGNMQHATKQGRMAAPSDATRRASVEKRRVAIIATDENGNELFFPSQAEAARVLGISRRHISPLCRKEYGYKKSKGYSLRYADEARQALAKPKREALPENERRERARQQMMGNQHSKGVPCSEKAKQASREKFSKTVIQYNLEMKVVEEHPSANSVRKRFGFSIDYALKNGGPCHGYYWRYKT